MPCGLLLSDHADLFQQIGVDTSWHPCRPHELFQDLQDAFFGVHVLARAANCRFFNMEWTSYIEWAGSVIIQFNSDFNHAQPHSVTNMLYPIINNYIHINILYKHNLQKYANICISIYYNICICISIYYNICIPVQIGPEGLGAPFCSYRTASPRCPSYKLAEPNVHRGRFLLQNGSPS